VDNYNGPSGLVVATGKGMLRTMLGSNSAIADIVPVDICVYMMIAIAWHTAMKHPKTIPVYHCCTGHLGTLTWGKATEYGVHHLHAISLENAICYPKLYLTENRFRYYSLRMCQEVLPAFILDCYMRMIGHKPIFSKISNKINKSVRTLDFFTSHSWLFPNDNSVMLQNEMSDIDQKIFGFDIKDLDWYQYFQNYTMGAKKYLLREDLARISKCRIRNTRLKHLENILYFSAIALVIKLVIFKSFKFRRIFFVLFRLFFAALSSITTKIGLRKQSFGNK